MLVVGGLGTDVQQLVSPLGRQSNAQQPALAPGLSDGSCSRIASWFGIGSERHDDVDVVASRCY